MKIKLPYMGTGLSTILIGVFSFFLGGILSWLWSRNKSRNNESTMLSRLREKQVDYDKLSIEYDAYRRKYLDLDDQYGELKNLERTYRVAYEDWKVRYKTLEKEITSGKTSTTLINKMSLSESKKVLEKTADQKLSVFDLSEAEIYSKYENLLSNKDKLDNTIKRIQDESEDLRALSKFWKAKAKKFKKSSNHYKVAFKGLLNQIKNSQAEKESKSIKKLQKEIEELSKKNQTILGHLRNQTNSLLNDLSVEKEEAIEKRIQKKNDLQNQSSV